MTERTERILLATMLGLFVVLGGIYSVVVPPFEASDELWHYPMVHYITTHWDLPVQDPANVGPWRQEGSQPPLYYAVAAAASFWIDTRDMDEVRHLNPHVDNGVVTPDGNINLVVHRTTREAFPWRGTVLAIHVIRFLSVLMGAAAVYLTFLIVREVLPDEPALALGATAIHAFTPMFAFISGSVNNDNLLVLLSSLALLMLLRMLCHQTLAKVGDESDNRVTSSGRKRSWAEECDLTFARVPVGRYLALGVVLGLAALTKVSSLALTVLTALVVFVRAVRRRSWAELFLGGAATLLPLVVVAGWWYMRNLRLYGDLTGFNAFFDVLGTREVPADLAQLWRERYSFLAAYWGLFGGLNVPMASWVYVVLDALMLVAGLGLGVLLLKRVLGADVDLVIDGWSFVICALWAAGVFVPWLGWARVTWSSQGRLVFPAISVWSLLMALGLTGWLPRRLVIGRWSLAVFLLALSVAAPFAWIQLAYELPEPLTDAQVAAIAHLAEADFGGVVRLLGWDLDADAVQPGQQLGVTLYWEALATAERDYTVFVHLLGKHELLVAQRDTFPGLGQLSTTWLQPGFRWADRYVLQVPSTAYTPNEARLEVGLYDAVSGARLAATGPRGEPLGDNVRFGQVEVRGLESDLPNPVSVNFGDRMMLVGYDLDRRAVRPDEEIKLTLYWQGLRSMDVNYTVSAQLVGSAQRKAAQRDGWPQDGAAPTAAWEPGRMIADARTLAIFCEAPPGAYGVRIVVYVLREGEIVHLPVIPKGGRMLSSHVTLTRVRVLP